MVSECGAFCVCVCFFSLLVCLTVCVSLGLHVAEGGGGARACLFLCHIFFDLWNNLYYVSLVSGVCVVAVTSSTFACEAETVHHTPS